MIRVECRYRMGMQRKIQNNTNVAAEFAICDAGTKKVTIN